jgi:3-isopropylmalate/(R)-2-methylmalate dehydratase small subunit
MEPFTRVTGVLAPLNRANVDTDQIIPKQFLKRIERSGYGPFLFYDWRREGNFILDKPEYAGAAVLVTGANFGCGSSREHAPWSLLDAGFRAVIASSFGDIFKNNSFRCGLLPVELPEPEVAELIRLATEEPGMEVTVDLAARRIRAGGFETSFAIDEFYRESLLNGWDEIALTLQRDADITRFEARRAAWLAVTR